ncbi:MAG: PIN domain-containing protein [Gammaproteobacteria bacterium]
MQAAIVLRRNYRIKVPDAIVAATAKVLGLPLMTNNTEDFRRAWLVRADGTGCIIQIK